MTLTKTASISRNKSGSRFNKSNDKKGKQPPSFQHLPLKRAKQLKKAWVEEHKIKRAWFAQKKREGLWVDRRNTAVPGTDQQADDGDNGNLVNGSGDGREDGISRNDGADGAGLDDEPLDDRNDGPSSAHTRDHHHNSFLQSPSKGGIKAKAKANGTGKAKDRTKRTSGAYGSTSTSSNSIVISKPRPKAPPQATTIHNEEGVTSHLPSTADQDSSKSSTSAITNKPSIRDLTRKAYSTSTLHTRHAKPMIHRKSHHGAGANNTMQRPHRPNQYQNKPTPVKGQPNMKLRMQAMLEKIKQTG